jgi:DNA-binding winged helix-turn-helix (wHTH) protein
MLAARNNRSRESTAMQLRFDDGFLFDTDRRQLSRGEQEVSLSPKAYELLRLLIEARPSAVAKEKLYRSLWPNTHVVEGNLPNLIAEIRGAVGDSGHHPRIVRTLHRFGYAFASAVEVVTPARSVGRELYAYSLRWKTTDLPLRAGENIIGRDPDTEVCVDAAGVSRRHARLLIDKQRVTIEDLNSKNGTFVRGVRITSSRVLLPGDEVSFGRVHVTLHVKSPDSSTTTLSKRYDR